MSELQQLQRQVEALECRLAAVEDVEAIHRLKADYAQLVDGRYARGVDAERIDELARQISELFTPDAVWDGGKGLGLCRGRQEIYQRMAKPTLRFSWHYFVKPRLQVEGDRAHGTWDILSPCTTLEGKPMWMAGVEHDEYARVDGAWLHSSMRLELVFLAPYERGWARKED